MTSVCFLVTGSEHLLMIDSDFQTVIGDQHMVYTQDIPFSPCLDGNGTSSAVNDNGSSISPPSDHLNMHMNAHQCENQGFIASVFFVR